MLNKQNEKLLQELLKKYKQGIISGLYPGNNITFTPTGCRDKIISSTGGGAGGGIESIQEGDNITIDDTDPLNPIVSAIGGSSSLFPNGLSEETVSRELTSADIGKLLIIVNDDVILTPASDMVSTGDLPKKFGIWCLNPTTKTSGFKVNTPSEICYLESATAFDGATGIGEIVSFMTLYDDDLVTSNIYPITDIMLSNEFTGTVGQLAIPYLLEQSQNAIPLSGTVSGSPVTGDIEFSDDIKIKSGDVSATDGYLKFRTGQFEQTTTDNIGLAKSEIRSSGTSAFFRVIDNNTGFSNQISVSTVSIEVNSTDTLSHGLSGIQDFTPNITDLDYTQKIYVDSAVNAIRPYKVYTAIITQTGTDAPTAVVLQNTLGITPTLTRFATGNYRITASNTFTANKTFCIVGQEANSGTGMNYIWASDSNDDEVLLQTYDGAGLGAALTDDKMDRLSVEIRVYE